MSEARTPVEIFCSYAHEDEAWLQKLETHLGLLKQQGLVSLWYDRRIIPGTDWAERIDAHLETASIIVLLISADFLASDYYYGIEMERALARQKAGEAVVIPIIVREVDWQSAPFAHLKVLPTNARALALWPNRDKALTDVVEGIRHVIEELPQLIHPHRVEQDFCPYLGLSTFTREKAEFFFGRDDYVKELIDRFKKSMRFLAIFGPSGSGKSSILQAGLLPRLQQDVIAGSSGWDVHISRPTDALWWQGGAGGSGEPSMLNVEQARLIQEREHKRLILVFDQFEELFTNYTYEACQLFIQQLQLILEKPSITVILIMRDDFYTQFMDSPILRAWSERSGKEIYVPRTLTRTELSDIIQKPALKVNIHFEEGLVDMLIKDTLLASDKTGQRQEAKSTVLPLLEFTLTELWKRRVGKTLTRKAYENIGGVTEGLTQWADNLFYSLDVADMQEAQRLLLALVYIGEERQGVQDARKRVEIRSLYRDKYAVEKTHNIIKLLASGKLFVTEYDSERKQGMVEIIHDTLLREWTLLQDWLHKYRAFLLWYQMQERYAQDWKEANGKEGSKQGNTMLLHKQKLKDAIKWEKEVPNFFAQDVQRFIDASKRLQRRQFLLRLTGGSFAAIAGTGGLTFWLKNFVLPRYVDLFPPYHNHSGTIYTLASSPDESRLASGSNDRTVQVYYANTAATIYTFRGHARTVTSVTWSPKTGYLIASSSADQTVRIWVSDNQVRGTYIYRGHHDAVLTVAWSPDGKYLASGSGNADRTVHIWSADEKVIWGAWAEGKPWDTAIGTRIATYTRHTGPVNCVVWSPDGKYLASGSGDATVHIWEATTGRQVLIYRGHIASGHVKTVAWSPDGKYLASGGFDKAIFVWSRANGQTMATYKGHKDAQVTGLAWSPDGRYLASASIDKTVQIWNVQAGDITPSCVYDEHQAAVECVLWSPKNTYIASAGEDKVVRTWQLK